MRRGVSFLLYGAALLAGFAAFSATGPASGEDDPSVGGDVTTMDIEFLREKLLKIWIIEESSDRHNQRRIAEKSFRGMTPYEPTGDEESDRENYAEYMKNDKHLRHYLTLEMDNSIEVIDICRRVLGTHVKPPSTDKAMRDLLDQELPAINWRNVELGVALDDLGRKLGITVRFSGVAKNEDVRIDLQLDPGFQLGQALEFVNEYHPLEITYEGGILYFKYLGAPE